MREWNKWENQIGIWMDRIFGFGLPERVEFVFNLHSEHFRSGSFLNSEPTIVSLQANGKDSGAISTLIHEILHAQISRNELLGDTPQAHIFGEALLGYFAPDGMLDERIGISAHVDIDQIYARNSAMRPSAANASLALLPAMKEYYWICGTKTIWQFLTEKKLL
jgi:hypothetical protein